MPQLFNLGGFTLQKTHTIRVNLIRSQDLNVPYLEIDPNDNSLYLRNVKDIKTINGRTILADRIIEA
ncbi:MAG: hypothetical protein VW270_00260 [Candidatus Poseidoniales archaeon]